MNQLINEVTTQNVIYLSIANVGQMVLAGGILFFVEESNSRKLEESIIRNFQI